MNHNQHRTGKWFGNKKQHQFILSLWFLCLWSHSIFLDLQIFPHRLQWCKYCPSKWFASMCLFMLRPSPSFPQTLQIEALICPLFPLAIMLGLLSISDFTFSSKSSNCPSSRGKFAIATVLLLLLSSGVSKSSKNGVFYKSSYLRFEGFPTPGIEPGPPGWEPGILTTRPLEESTADVKPDLQLGVTSSLSLHIMLATTMVT